MHLTPIRLEAEVTDDRGGRSESASVDGSPGTVGLGPLEVELELSDDGATWAVSNRGDRDVRIRSIGLVYRIDGGDEPVRVFRNGYQSWSPTTTGVLGVDADPSVRADLEFLQAVHHADQRRARTR